MIPPKTAPGTVPAMPPTGPPTIPISAPTEAPVVANVAMAAVLVTRLSMLFRSKCCLHFGQEISAMGGRGSFYAARQRLTNARSTSM